MADASIQPLSGKISVEMREKKAVALSSVVAAVFLTGMKLVVGLETNSLGILSEAAHSGLDLVAALMTFFAVRVATRPPDDEHHYGHAKVENVSALMETVLLVVTCAWIIWEALHRLASGSAHVEANIWSFIVIITAIVIDVGRSRALARVARKFKSQALEADALHFSSDVWSSLTVLLGILFVSLGYQLVDAVAALVVAFLVLFVSYKLGRRTVDALMDRVSARTAEQARQEIGRVPGVEEVRALRMRSSGVTVYLDATIAIRRTLPFESAHRIMDDVEQAVYRLHPDADVTVHGEPCVSEDETIVDKVRMIVVGQGLGPPHNLEVHLTGGEHYIDFDVEYRRGQSFVEAHELAGRIEEEIRNQIPNVGKVTVHLEEFTPSETRAGTIVAGRSTLSEDISSKVLEDRRVLACRDITLLLQGSRYHATLTCEIDRQATLEEVHRIISEIETRLYHSFPQIRRITIHAEPATTSVNN